MQVLKHHWKWIGLLGIGSILLARLVGATTVLEKTFPALVQEADTIAVGTVTAIESVWDTTRAAPFTLITFSDLEVSKGAADQTELTLHVLGGPTPSGMVMRIVGTPQFHLGDRVVCLLYTSPSPRD